MIKKKTVYTKYFNDKRTHFHSRIGIRENNFIASKEFSSKWKTRRVEVFCQIDNVLIRFKDVWQGNPL
jgi:hypothetical protein